MNNNLPPLLPCPFCGNDKNIAMANEKHDHSGGYFIGCPACDASTGLRYAMGDDPRPLLIEQWNRREALEASRAAVPAGWVPLTDATLSKAHTKVRAILAHHGIKDVHTALVADLIYAVQDIVIPVTAPQPVAQPSECEWTNCPRRVGDVCCNDQAKPEQAAQPTQAASDVLAERQRQISVEGWTPEHDDEHDDGCLAEAAACYALGDIEVSADNESVAIWPWEPKWFKPEGKRRNLIKAGALILAEIERLDRAASPKPKD